MRAGEEVTLTSLEFKLLRFFTTNAERVLTREALLNDVWGYNSYPTTRTVDNLILKLRQTPCACGSPFQPVAAIEGRQREVPDQGPDDQGGRDREQRARNAGNERSGRRGAWPCGDHQS